MSSRRLCPALTVLALAAVPSWAGDRPWTTDDILALKVVTDPNVSPDGRTVAYVVESLNAEKRRYSSLSKESIARYWRVSQPDCPLMASTIDSFSG